MWGTARVIALLFSLPAVSVVGATPRSPDCPAVSAGDPLALEVIAHRGRLDRSEVPEPKGALQRFTGVGNRLVYNPTGEFLHQGRPIIAARVEALHDERETEVMFFERGPGGEFRPIAGTPVYRMQDPFVADLRNELLFGGVETYDKPDGTGLGYRTVFFRGPDIFNLKRFAEGPDGMKDIRVTRLLDGRYLVATRPQRRFDPERPELDAGSGTIGMTVISDLRQLNSRNIIRAQLYPALLPPGSWGGINELTVIDARTIGVLGHVASYTGPNRNYMPFVTLYNPLTWKFSKIEVILERVDLPRGFSKRPDLRNVLFSGGLKGARLWVGAGDAQVFRVDLGYGPYGKLRRP